MPEMHLRQPGFTYSACKPFTKHKERINKFMKTGDTRYIYRNKLDKACFQHDAAYSDSKDLAKRIASDNVLRDNAFNIAKNPQYNGCERGLAGMVYKFFDKKSASKTGKITKTSERVKRAERAIASEQKGGDVHRSPSIEFDESDKSRQAISHLHKKILLLSRKK